MPLFICDKCKCIENTALCLYWGREKGSPALCSQCEPRMGKWHNHFPRITYAELQDKEGVLNPPKELK